MSGENLLVVLVTGAVAGWLAGQIVRGAGFGLITSICVGVVGALIDSWMLPKLGIHLGAGNVASIMAATLGGIALLLVMGILQRRPRW